MPLTLTAPLVITINSHDIKSFNINRETNRIDVVVADLDTSGNEVRRRTLGFAIEDGVGNVNTPSAWPSNYPTGNNMCDMVEQFMYLGLQDRPGEDGLGPGVIT